MGDASAGYSLGVTESVDSANLRHLRDCEGCDESWEFAYRKEFT